MITTIVSLYILLIALPVCAGTFVDDFEDGNIAGWSAVGEWSVESGELVGENMEPAYDSGAIFFGELTWSNYTIEADVKLIRSSGDPCAAGIFVRAQHEPGQLPHMYCFGFHQGTPSSATTEQAANAHNMNTRSLTLMVSPHVDLHCTQTYVWTTHSTGSPRIALSDQPRFPS